MAVTLSQLTVASLNVACSRCERKGRYQVANLIKMYGNDKELPELASDLRGDCPNKDTFVTNRCDVYFPGLGRSTSSLGGDQ